VSTSPIVLRFLQLDLESGYDFVTIYAGSQPSGSPIASVSGQALPTPISTGSTQVSIRFTSDSSVQGLGFIIEWSSVTGTTPATGTTVVSQPPSSVLFVPSASSSTFQGCLPLQLVSAPSGTISNGPGDYPQNARCQWQLTESIPMTLIFTDLQMETNYDFVIVYDNGVEVMRATGSQLPPPIRTRSILKIVLTSDGSIQGRGFSANFAPTVGTRAWNGALAAAPDGESPLPPPNVARPPDAVAGSTDKAAGLLQPAAVAGTAAGVVLGIAGLLTVVFVVRRQLRAVKPRVVIDGLVAD